MAENIPRILLAAPASGSGKTVITCALLRAFQKEGRRPASFKCGPDYIDPLFHEQVFGIRTRNLDPFFSDAEELNDIILRGSRSQDADLAILEGVMGYYDGLGGISTEASAYDVARKTGTPVILVINAKGASLSLLAQIRGFLDFRPDHGIAGVILNRTTKGMFPLLKKLIEEELGIRAFGYLPAMEEAQFESRHLGLLLPGEIEGLHKRLDRLADTCRKSIDLEALLEAAGTAEPIIAGAGKEEPEQTVYASFIKDKSRIRIGVARDEAFCFYYRENLDLLERLGAEIVPFSPLHDAALPEGIKGLIIGGGYPELYAGELSQNQSMREAVRRAVAAKLPTLAECGGFMYLMEQMEGMDGQSYPMCGALPGRAFRTGRLQRFGYVCLTAQEDQMGGPAGTQIRGHEFHYFDTDYNGAAYRALKPAAGHPEERDRDPKPAAGHPEERDRDPKPAAGEEEKKRRGWDCMVGTDSLLAGFPHLYYPSNPAFARRFLEKAGAYEKPAEPYGKPAEPYEKPAEPYGKPTV